MIDQKSYIGNIDFLNDNQVFVFGSNPVGINGNPLKGTGGAALHALNKGWVQQGEKMDNRLSRSGKAWGLTTVSYPGKKRSMTPDQIIAGIKNLYDFAHNNPSLEFLVAYKVKGIPLNGYSHDEIASFFIKHTTPKNIVFDKDFLNLMKSKLLITTPKPRQSSLF